uniref:ABC transporter domain-containing protein n=2 Tax=Caenorhabditis japonica TaxID=281687 RepID=A0A8R1DKN3_CAEJA
MEMTTETCSLLSAGQSEYGAAASMTSALDPVDPVTISWHSISICAAKSKKQILDNVSGIARPGQLLALMGASGAGKTTLLNMLLSRNLKGLETNGSVKVNGHELGRGITAISGYAQQDELFVGTLTVKEYLNVQAKLRVNGDAEKRRRRVANVMAQLGLYKCQNTRIGSIGGQKGISGGEMRRLTFACELLSNPSVLFCDEPTTGLDSFMAESVVQVLSNLAKSGRTVICTIHQPSSQLYLMFDRVMFMAGGKTAFLGAPREAIQFFEDAGFACPRNFNPADLIIHTLAVMPNEEEKCQQRIEVICAKFDNSSYGRTLQFALEKTEEGRKPSERKKTGVLTQISALLERAMIDTWRNPSLTRAKIIQKTIMGVFIGLLYLQSPLTSIGISNLNGALFYLVCELTYSTIFGILNFLPTDFPLVSREYHDGLYSVFSYYVARCLSYLPLFTADGLVMLLVSYWLVGFSNSLTQVLFACLIAFLIEQSSSACGIMLSCVAPSLPIAMSTAGPMLTLLSLTGGLYANVGALPTYISWIQYLSWFRYGFEAFAINQWSSVNEPNSTIWTDEEKKSEFKGALASFNDWVSPRIP